MRWNPTANPPVYPIGQILLPDFNLVNIQAYLVVEVCPKFLGISMLMTISPKAISGRNVGKLVAEEENSK